MKVFKSNTIRCYEKNITFVLYLYNQLRRDVHGVFFFKQDRYIIVFYLPDVLGFLVFLIIEVTIFSNIMLRKRILSQQTLGTHRFRYNSNMNIKSLE